jgi:1,4-dihydroxy-6-naphthoate synthase
MDLGENWYQKTGLPIPLGLIGIKRDLEDSLKIRIKQLILSSLEYATRYVEQIFPFIKSYAQELDRDVIFQHIELYVNEFSFDIGTAGKSAIVELFKSSQSGEKVAQINFI